MTPSADFLALQRGYDRCAAGHRDGTDPHQRSAVRFRTDVQADRL